MVDFRQIDMPPESIFLLTPWQVHLPTDADQAIEVFLISFTPDFLPAGLPALPVCMENPVTPDREGFKEIWHICERLLQEFKSGKALQQPVLQYYLALLLTLFSRYLPQNDGASQLQPELLTRYRELMEKHLLSWSSSGEYARALHVTADHLNEVVKQETGQTASALLAARRILEGRRHPSAYHSQLPGMRRRCQCNGSFLLSFPAQNAGATVPLLCATGRAFYQAITSNAGAAAV